MNKNVSLWFLNEERQVVNKTFCLLEDRRAIKEKMCIFLWYFQITNNKEITITLIKKSFSRAKTDK